MSVETTRYVPASSPLGGSEPSRGADSPNERPLLARLQAGDEAACELLVREHTGRLLAVARRYLRQEEDARDAVQEGFVAAFRSISRFEGTSSLSTWLHRIVINCCLMKLRSGRRRPETSIEELLPRFDETGHRILDGAELPETAEDAIERDETKRRVRAAIARLPQQYRTVILLRDIEEVSTADAAKMLGLTANAVKIRLHRARQALRELLVHSES